MEVWKDIDGFTGMYQVSNLGRYRGLDRWVKNRGGIRFIEGKILTGSMAKGYRICYFHLKGKVKTYYIHQIVAMAFLGHKPNGLVDVIDHINGDKLDNRVSNLRIVSSWVNSTEWRDKKTLGVSYYHNRCSHKKWGARITFDGSRKHLGYYLTQAEAKASHTNFCNKHKQLNK